MALPARRTPATSTVQATPSTLAIIVRVVNDGQNSRHCALVITDVVEVMRPLPIEGLANAPPFVLGVSIIRGAPTPVVDAARLLAPAGGERPEAHPARPVVPSRFVVMRVGERRVALAVEAVLGIRPLARETLRALPPLLRNASEQVVTALGTLDAQLLTVLGGSYLVPPALWEALATSKASG